MCPHSISGSVEVRQRPSDVLTQLHLGSLLQPDMVVAEPQRVLPYRLICTELVECKLHQFICRRATMSVSHEKQQDQRKRIVAFLAQDSDVPIGDVATLFEQVRAELAVGARVTQFLNIFAIRHVQELLRKRRADKQSAALGGLSPLAV